MKITIGSKNKTKVKALEEIISDYELLKNAEVVALNVLSEVSEQPKTLEETVKGANNRAKNAWQDCEYSFGIESGIFEVPYTKTGYMDVTVCSIFDGKNNHLGISSMFEYPKKVTELILKGDHDISQAYKEIGLTSAKKLGEEEGAVGQLTKGRIIRTDYNKQAITMALIHLENPELY
jgi:inosine/xanthosine triphosphatase